MQYFNKNKQSPDFLPFKLKEGIYLPYFVVNFGALFPTTHQYSIQGEIIGINQYMHYQTFIPPDIQSFESLHVLSKKDELFFMQNEYLVFDQPEYIEHQQGHKPPKYLSNNGDHENLIKFHSFISRQYTLKFGEELEYINFDTNLMVKENQKKMEVILPLAKL